MQEMEFQERAQKLVEVHECFQQLSSPQADHAAICEKLAALGIQLRGNILPRGRISMSAEDNYLPEECHQVLSGLFSESMITEVRYQVVRALEQWDDGRSVLAISKQIKNFDEPEDVLFAQMRALATIGGPTAAITLKAATHHQNDDIADQAKWLLKELQTGGTIDPTEGITKGMNAE